MMLCDTRLPGPFHLQDSKVTPDDKQDKRRISTAHEEVYAHPKSAVIAESLLNIETKRSMSTRSAIAVFLDRPLSSVSGLLR